MQNRAAKCILVIDVPLARSAILLPQTFVRDIGNQSHAVQTCSLAVPLFNSFLRVDGVDRRRCAFGTRFCRLFVCFVSDLKRWLPSELSFLLSIRR